MDDRIAVRATGLTQTYGEGDTVVRALRDVTFEIPRGEFLVLQAASGSPAALETKTGIQVLTLLRDLTDSGHRESHHWLGSSCSSG